MLKRKLSIVAAAALLVPGAGRAATDADLQALRAEIAALKTRLAALETKQAKAGAPGKSQLAPAPEVFAGPDGFKVRSADGAHELRVGGIIQAQGRFFADGLADGDSFLVRRARPVIDGKLYEHFQFRIQPELANDVSLLDAYVDWVPLDAFAVRAGKFKSPIGLERLQSAGHLLFVERGLPANLLPNRDIGVMAYGDLWGGALHYDLAVLNGAGDGGSITSTDGNQSKDVAARLFATPFKNTRIGALRGLSLGAAVSVGDHRGSTPSYRTPGQETFFSYASGAQIDGDQNRLSPQLFWSLGPVAILGEYAVSESEVVRGPVRRGLSHDSWQIGAAWAITGEAVTLKGVKVKRPTHERGPGAWVVAARYGELDIDDEAFLSGVASATASASKAQSFGLALHWLPNSSVRLSLGFDSTWFEGGAAEGDRVADRETESVLFSQMQLMF
jgi:phosphate-selective porin OprO/OprP